MRRMIPKCRFCGTKVDAWGLLCRPCYDDAPKDEYGDPIFPPSEQQIADAEGIHLREEGVDY
jgi:hypothetical protein